MDAPAPLPLAGIRVLDLTHALAGPYCTMLLGDLGADIIKIEPPSGDHSRQWGPPFINGESSYFLSVNRNKRSVVLDLKRPAALAVAEALAMACDVVVENFKPGTMARLGLDAQKLQGKKATLVYASISGFGQDQPTLAGYDQIAQGTSGMMSVNATPDSAPTKVGVPIGDITAGMFAAAARRRSPARGCRPHRLAARATHVPGRPPLCDRRGPQPRWQLSRDHRSL